MQSHLDDDSPIQREMREQFMERLRGRNTAAAAWNDTLTRRTKPSRALTDGTGQRVVAPDNADGAKPGNRPAAI